MQRARDLYKQEQEHDAEEAKQNADWMRADKAAQMGARFEQSEEALAKMGRVTESQHNSSIGEQFAQM